MAAPFTLEVQRGDGLALLAVNWKAAGPPADSGGFAIEYHEPGGDQFFPVRSFYLPHAMECASFTTVERGAMEKVLSNEAVRALAYRAAHGC